ncbi:calcium ion binding protein [Arthrobacter sp. Hiyo8]|nr:calcium ion binding protein [Arthrobacter sp. Hiyo8]
MPATGTTTLSFWYQPHTADDTCTGTACRYDWMEAQVRTATGTTLASLFKLSSNSGTWTQLSTNLSAYNGQTVVLWFNVHLDGSSPADDTWMYLDDVTLTNTQTTPPHRSPTGVTAAAGNASATVTWTARANGGSAITSYAVTPHAGTTTLAPVTVSGNPPATTANITGLTNGTAYTFTVTATNAIGTSRRRRPRPQSRRPRGHRTRSPTGVTAAAGNASATVTWTAPANGGSAITSYAVTPHAGTTTLARSPSAEIRPRRRRTSPDSPTAPPTPSPSPPRTPSAPPGLGGLGTGHPLRNNDLGHHQRRLRIRAHLLDHRRGQAPVASTTAHTGTGSALLGLASGTEPLGDSSLSQTITIPPPEPPPCPSGTSPTARKTPAPATPARTTGWKHKSAPPPAPPWAASSNSATTTAPGPSSPPTSPPTKAKPSPSGTTSTSTAPAPPTTPGCTSTTSPSPTGRGLIDLLVAVQEFFVAANMRRRVKKQPKAPKSSAMKKSPM